MGVETYNEADLIASSEMTAWMAFSRAAEMSRTPQKMALRPYCGADARRVWIGADGIPTSSSADARSMAFNSIIARWGVPSLADTLNG